MSEKNLNSDLEKRINKTILSDKTFTEMKKDLMTFYWTRKNPQVISNIIENFTSEGDILFDPFLGSAPILFSLDNSNKNLYFVGSEINEMPISFMKFNLSEISTDELDSIRRNFIKFYDNYQSLYEYESPLYNESIVVSKIILDKSEEGYIPKQFIFEGKEKLTIDKNDTKFFKKYTSEYQKRCNKLKQYTENQDIDLLPNSRIAISEGMRMSDLFNPINFHILTEYSKEFKNDKSMIVLLASVLHLCRLTDLKSQSQFPFWVPKKDVVERNILLLLKKRIEKVCKEKKYNTLQLNLVKTFKELKKKKKGIYILNKPSQMISENELPNESVDLVITDPPYFDQVAYSEYLKIWEHFCGYKSQLRGELIHSNRKEEASNKDAYLENLYNCFSLVTKKLKNNGLSIIFFKDSKPENIHLFIKQLAKCGLKFIKTCHLNKKKYTYKQNTTIDTTVSGECLFFFKKTPATIKRTANDSSASNDQIKNEIEKAISSFAKKYYKNKGEMSLGELYDNGLILYLYEKDLLKHISNSSQVAKILKNSFKLSKNRKYTIG